MVFVIWRQCVILGSRGGDHEEFYFWCVTPCSLVEHYQRSEWFCSARHIPEVVRRKRCSAVCTNRMNTCMDCNLRICTCSVLIHVLGWGDSTSHMYRAAVISLNTLWRNVNMSIGVQQWTAPVCYMIKWNLTAGYWKSHSNPENSAGFLPLARED